nr:MAG TPA: hypothetical protein [Caudoviricetes sp.]
MNKTFNCWEVPKPRCLNTFASNAKRERKQKQVLG